MRLSIVTTLYRSAGYIDEFYRRLSEVVIELTDDYEIVFVNDGSPDDSLELALKLREADSRLKIVDLSCNFGHHKAIMSGLEYSCGDYVFLLDSDLEERPEWLGLFYATLRKEECDLVAGVQEVREGGAIKALGGSVFYRLFSLMSSTPVPAGVTVARIMTRRFVDALLQHEEREIFFAGLCAITGFKQATVPVSKTFKGETTYGLYERVKQAVDAVTSFSSRPLYVMFGFGCFVFLFSVLYIAWILIQKVFFEIRVGFTSVIASIWAVGGIGMMFTGIVGIYIGRIFSEVKRRPVTIKRLYGLGDE